MATNILVVEDDHGLAELTCDALRDGGFDVARFARRVIPEVAVIYVSGAVEISSYRVDAVPDSIFLQKPFEMHTLVLELHSQLSCGEIVYSHIH